MDQTWKPNVTVSAIIENAGRFLMVEEHTSRGLCINQPAGHLEVGESLITAAIRETLEETAHPFTPEALVGIYRWHYAPRDITYLRFCFAGTVGEPLLQALDPDIVRTLWLTYEELRALDPHRLRSPLVLKNIEDYLAGKRYPLDMLQEMSAPDRLMP